MELLRRRINKSHGSDQEMTAMVENLQLGKEELVQMLEVPVLVPAILSRGDY